MTFLTVALFSVVLLAFQPTRLYGVIGWTALLLTYPYATLGVVLAAGAAYYYWRKHL